MKEDVMTALISPNFSPSEYYHETGMCQWIARSAWFETVMLGVVGFNAVWISVDMDVKRLPGFLLSSCFVCGVAPNPRIRRLI